MPNTPVQATGEAMAAISSVIMGTKQPETIHRLAIEDLRKLSMKELRSLFDLLNNVDETVCAFLNEPRFATGNQYNAAGEIGISLLDHLNLSIAMVEQVAMDAEPTTQEEREHRAWLLIQRAAHYSESLHEFITAAIEVSLSASGERAI